MIDHLRNTQSVGLEELAVLVLDEADRLLEMGFAEEVCMASCVASCMAARPGALLACARARASAGTHVRVCSSAVLLAAGNQLLQAPAGAAARWGGVVCVAAHPTGSAHTPWPPGWSLASSP
jgi:hypothetical protein